MGIRPTTIKLVWMKKSIYIEGAGVRQRENLSPLLFALYLNDFEFNISKKFNGLPFLRELINEHLSDDEVEYLLH